MPAQRRSGLWMFSQMDTVRQIRMDDGDPHDRIARLEEHLERLGEARERCVKIALVARVAMIGGGLTLVLMLFGLVSQDAAIGLGAIAAVLGGIVAYGSNQTTSEQVAAEIQDAEALRRELIGSLELRLVHDRGGSPTLH